MFLESGVSHCSLVLLTSSPWLVFRREISQSGEDWGSLDLLVWTQAIGTDLSECCCYHSVLMDVRTI
jgi:hypothetical protein